MVTKQQIERNAKINRIAAMIKKTFDAGQDIDKEKLIIVVMKDLMTSRRTAVEYIGSAKIYITFTEEKGILKKAKQQKKLNIGI